MRYLFVFLAALTAEGADVPAWMSGCWEGTAGPMKFEEQWSKPLDGLMLGASRVSKQGRVVFHEFMRLEQKGGNVSYTPRIGSSEKPVTFTATKVTSGEAVFENPAHDFPQRIIYARNGEQLNASIEGVQKGKPKREEFPMRRSTCRAE